MNRPIVSILMITYNHEKFINKAIGSVLMQKTNFPIELVIGEDCSTDNTREIVFDYERKYPNIIKLITSKNNVGMIENSFRTLNKCKGKYVAFCEGDDFWNKSYKLQKQINFLENNHDFGMVHSDIDLLLFKRKKLIKNLNKKKYGTIPKGNIYDDFLIDSFINTCSVCVKCELMKKVNIRKLLQEKDWFIVDRTFWLEISRKAKIGYIDESLATYRVHDDSVTHSTNRKEELKIYKQSYDIRFFFIRKYGCKECTRRCLCSRYNKGLLKFAFLLKDKKLAVESYKYIKKYQSKEHPLTLEDKFYYIGAISMIRFLVRCFYIIQINLKKIVEKMCQILKKTYYLTTRIFCKKC